MNQFERKKEIEAHYREKKTEIYDEFLSEFFKLFHSDARETDDDIELVNFLREWQRKMILWGGQEVVLKYLLWLKNLQKGKADAQSMFLMENFFLEIRKDLGHNNSKLEKGTFIHLMLQNSDLFLSMAKDNPDVTLDELVAKEKELGITQ